ncbi:MAG: ATP-binding protein [Acidimicrobiales bacterium]
MAELGGLAGAHPYRERLWAQLILALYRAGRQADALAAYQRLRHVLGNDLGIDPSPELARLEEAVLLHKPELDWAPPAAVAVGPGVQKLDGRDASSTELDSNLPVPRSSFVGRGQELTELSKLLRQGRLLTIVGPGGAGKTRLAIELAHRVRSDYGQVRLVELAPLADASLIPFTVAGAFGVHEELGREPLEALVTALRSDRSLLVLDNCEHLLDGVAQLADVLLRAVPRLSVVTTSREPLRVEGEQVWRTPALAVPSSVELGAADLLDFDSARLFVYRATDAHHRFKLSGDNARSVAEICRRLDGIPLAIELAAARTPALTPAQIASRLDDRFALLRTGPRTAPARQRTLLATIEWSHDLCSAVEKTTYRRLSVFAGGFTLEAAEAICSDGPVERSDVLDLLAMLTDRSLVVVDEAGVEARYDLLETLRAFALQQLEAAGEGAATRDRHLEFYGTLAARANAAIARMHDQAALVGAQKVWFHLLELEHDNLRAALTHGISLPAGLRLCTDLARFWDLRGHLTEGVTWLNRALDSNGDADEPARLRAEQALAILLMRRGEFRRAEELFGVGMKGGTARGDGHIVATSTRGLAWLAGFRADLHRCRELNEKALPQWRALHDDYEVASCLGALSWVAGHQCDFPRAWALHDECIAIRRQIGDEFGIAWSLGAMGRLALAQGDYDQAERLLADSFTMCRNIGDSSALLITLAHRGELERARHHPERARELLEESHSIALELGLAHGRLWALVHLLAAIAQRENREECNRVLDEVVPLIVAMENRLAVAEVFEVVAHTTLQRGHACGARRLLATAQAARDVIGAPIPPYKLAEHREVLAQVGEQLDGRIDNAADDEDGPRIRNAFERGNISAVIASVEGDLRV